MNLHSGNESSDDDGSVSSVHSEDASNNYREWDVVCSTHLSGKSNDNAANGEAKEYNGQRLPSSEAKGHDS